MAEWRVGQSYDIHVHEGDVPIATFHSALDARQAVEDHNDIDALRAAIRYAQLSIDAWRSGDERGADVDVINTVDRILEL